MQSKTIELDHFVSPPTPYSQNSLRTLRALAAITMESKNMPYGCFLAQSNCVYSFRCCFHACAGKNPTDSKLPCRNRSRTGGELNYGSFQQRKTAVEKSLLRNWPVASFDRTVYPASCSSALLKYQVLNAV